MIGGKKKESEPADEDESEQGDSRTEGMNAHVFSSSVGANGYIPQHKEPPRYIKVRAHNKKEREFNRMFLAQELAGSKQKQNEEQSKVPGLTTVEVPQPQAKTTWKGGNGGAIWATEFSKDGKYLAAAGQDQVVRVWSVLSSHEEREAHEREEDANVCKAERLSAPVFASKPIREFIGHTSTVLDLSWSKNNFLLSSSMDKSVRLWHVSREECLCTFKHKDFVTSIAFHPKDDRFFLAGSLDSILRLWSIPDKTVAFWAQLPDLITAVSFSPDGKTAMAGVLSGLCLFYETEGLKYQTQIHVRSSRGKNAKGSKITSIRCCIYPPNDKYGETKVLITTNDSRVRMYNLHDKSLEMKFKGHENTCSQIKASISDDAAYVVCGSEDRKAYIWATGPNNESEGKDKRPVEMFQAHADMVTTAVMAPVTTRQLLNQSGDPIYDLCNPPPVTLLSRAESNVSSRAPTIADAEKRNSDSSETPVKKPEETPAYLARSRHEDGNIIVTADHSGTIKVFRQDCAYVKRRNDTWESGSTISKAMGMARSGSISHGRRSGQWSRRNSTATPNLNNGQMPSDRILSWRNSIAYGDSLGDSQSRTSQASLRTDRSISPGKVLLPQLGDTSPALASTARQQPYASASPQGQGSISVSNLSIASASPSPPKRSAEKLSRKVSDPKEDTKPAKLPISGFSFANEEDNPLKLDGTGKSYQFWNFRTWQGTFGVSKTNDTSESKDTGGLRPEMPARGNSIVSQLSDELSGQESGGDESGGEVMKCGKCRGTEFRVNRSSAGRKLVCGNCGWVAE